MGTSNGERSEDINIEPKGRLAKKKVQIGATKMRQNTPGDGATDKHADVGSDDECVPDSGTVGLNLNVKPGTVTLIAGPMGSGKSTLCRQFLRKKSKTSVDPPDENSRVLISFEIASAEEVSNPLPEDKTFTTLRFTQSRFDLNVLVGHINWILDHGCERLAFDGLSEWITTFEKPEASRLLEVLMKTVRQEAKPSVFMTYEMPLQEDPLAPAAMGAEADNVVAIRKVPINDELRSVIYVLKRSPGSQEEKGEQCSDAWPTQIHPAELVWKKVGKDGRAKLEVQPTSLEAFTGLLNPSGQVSPARVLIQLFAENKAEQDFNKQLEHQLESEFKQRVNLTFSHFSLSEIGSTLETAFGAGKPSEAFNLAIHAVDEWWLKAEQTTKFLRPLKKQEVAGGPDYRDFWWWEIEKGLSRGANKTNKSWRAVPGYLDFAMFCVNPAAMTDEARIGYFGSKSSKLGRTRSGKRKQWRRLLASVPRVWARPISDRRWFEVDPGSSETVLEFALEATGQQQTPNLERKAVFYFDSSTRETCSCMFFELAWAFGASESFLAKDSSGDRTAAENAMAFLQFLVIEGLMPARSSIQPLNYNSEPILFSRHWYSTLRRCSEDKPSTAKRRQGSAPLDRGTLVALPFMPTGLPKEARQIESLLSDIAVCHNRWLDRARAYCKGNSNPLPGVTELAQVKDSKISVAQKVMKALRAYGASRKWLLKMSSTVKNPTADGRDDEDPQNWTAGLDDLIEIASWGALRLQLLFGESGRFPSPDRKAGTVVEALHEARWVRHSLPDLTHLLKRKFSEDNVVPTGYVCSGSWMYGVDRKSRSSEIQAQILSALTSLDNAERRAEAGAGMSARKDFFYVKGDQPAKGMEYLHWRELLRYGAARTRRRDWVLASSNEPFDDTRTALNNPTDLYTTVQSEMLSCLRLADLRRQEYAKHKSTKEAGRKRIINQLLERAKAAVDEIYRKALKKRRAVDLLTNKANANGPAH